MKTIVFSELPQNEKKKYFNFLLENEINFSRDENGYYVALVKLLNPAFYGKTNTNMGSSGGFENLKNSAANINNQIGPEVGGKPRSSSQTSLRGSTKGPLNKRSSKSPIRSNKSNFEKPKEHFKVQ